MKVSMRISILFEWKTVAKYLTSKKVSFEDLDVSHNRKAEMEMI
jgi:hypothetical protein